MGNHYFKDYFWHYRLLGASSIADRGTTVQAKRSQVRFLMRSLDTSIDLILLASIRLWGPLSLKQVPGIFLGLTWGLPGMSGWLTSPPLVSQFPRKCGSLDISQLSGPLWTVTGIALPSLHTSDISDIRYKTLRNLSFVNGLRYIHSYLFHKLAFPINMEIRRDCLPKYAP
jgi:hypothetical protein